MKLAPPSTPRPSDRAWNEATGRGERADRPKKRVESDKKPEPLCTLTFYEATRDSFTSRLLEQGQQL
jgi:hypothetical protein